MSDSKQVAEEKRAESEEEVSERLVEARRTRPVTKRELAPRAKEQTPKPQAPLTKARIAFNIPIKSVKHLGISQPQPPRLKAKLRSFAKLQLFSIRVQPTTIITPTISVAPKAIALENIRVPTLMPVTTRRLSTPPLRLRSKRVSDVSVRPLVRCKPVRNLRTVKLVIKTPPVAIIRPHVVPIFMTLRSTLRIPKIRAVIPAFEEEVEKVIYKLKLMGCKEEFISKCVNAAYDMNLSLGKISEILQRGDEDNIELMRTFPKYVSDAFDRLLMEGRQAVTEIPQPPAMGPPTEENVLDELFQPVKGGSFLGWKTHRPLCIILAGDDPKNGMKMVEDLMSTKYTFHGFYEFSQNLPWQKAVESVKVKVGFGAAELVKKMEKGIEKGIYEKIVSRDLIISDVVSAEKKDDVVKGLRDISHRGAKCVILYAKDVRGFEDLDLEVTGVDFKIVGLPKLNGKIRRLVGTLVGVDLEKIPAISVDQLWHEAVRLYEEEAGELDKKLPHVPCFPERESMTHYLMKRLVYNSLKNKEEYKAKNIRVEDPLWFLDEEGKIKKIIPDIVVDDECWEVETGYPFKDEPIMDPGDPFARLVSKLEKYREEYLKIRVVVPSIYAHMFREKIKQAKRYFREVHDRQVKFYTLQWYEKAGIKFFM